MACPCCGGVGEAAFSLPILSGSRIAAYESCVSCGSLFCPSPDWLPAAYESSTAADAVDGGAGWRNGMAAELGYAIRDLVPSGPWLDYGSGQRLLATVLGRRRIAVDAYDPYRMGGVVSPIPGAYALIFCLEVIEHCPDPVDLLRRLAACCRPGGAIFLSTWLRDPDRHGREWRYLSTEMGQHVTFCSRSGLAVACRRAGLRWICTVRPEGSEELQIHCLSPGGSALPAVAEAAAAIGMAVDSASSEASP